MKSLKTVIKRASSPKISQTNTALQPLSTQRSKANSRDVFNKYNQNLHTDLSKQSIIGNKYRIVTEPIDDNMLQLAKSYAKLSRSKHKQIKFDSQHNSIKSRQKTLSKEKYINTVQGVCPNCHIYERQIQIMKEEIKRIVSLKQKWKYGQIIVQDFVMESGKYQLREFRKQIFTECLLDIRQNLIDLMKDIQVLTEVDYPKLLSHNIFSCQQSLSPGQQESEIKLLLQQLREQSEGKFNSWDFDLEGEHSNFKAIFRNLKNNLMQTIRENLQLKTYHFLPKKDGSVLEEDIRRVIFQILRGLRK